MFNAIIHQLNGKDVQSEEQNMLVKKLRADVSSYILQHFSTFQKDLMSRVFDKFSNRSSIENMDEECRKIATSLSTNGYWGGNETLYAVLLLFKINILIINEEGASYFVDKFDESSDKTIVLAFKLMDGVEKKQKNISNIYRNHYESVVAINPELIFSLAQMISSKIETSELEKSQEIETISD